MQFMADIYLKCEHCEGKRFKTETLDVKYQGESIADILDMTVEDAYSFFDSHDGKLERKIAEKLSVLYDVGMGYVKLGQASNTLSGGEAQRIKLASYLAKAKTEQKTLFIFDEPTTGLHFDDIDKLLNCFNVLIENNNSVVIIEHNLDVIKSADYVIDLGPDAGDKGGEIIALGTPEEIVKNEKSITGKFLKEYLN
jgi:excinuclease ABC subunit A